MAKISIDLFFAAFFTVIFNFSDRYFLFSALIEVASSHNHHYVAADVSASQN